jgi:hypothetical protein
MNEPDLTQEDLELLEEERQEEERLKEKRRWLQSLSQKDRDFIARYGEEMWKRCKEAELL